MPQRIFLDEEKKLLKESWQNEKERKLISCMEEKNLDL